MQERANRSLARLESEANRLGFEELGALAEAAAHYHDDERLYAKLGQAKQVTGLVELVAFLGELPRMYGCAGGEEYVLGFVPVAGLLDNQSADKVRYWNEFCVRALELAREGRAMGRAGSKVWEGRTEVGKLLAEVLEFIDFQHPLMEMTRKVDASMPFGQAAREEALGV